jgi:hypothetical protein
MPGRENRSDVVRFGYLGVPQSCSILFVFVCRGTRLVVELVIMSWFFDSSQQEYRMPQSEIPLFLVRAFFSFLAAMI